MRALRLAALLVAAIAVGGGAVACSQAVSGTGTLAADAGTPSGSPSGSTTSSPDPSPTETTPSPTPSPTADVRKVRRLALCVRGRAAITTTNSNFNKAKTRDGQIKALRGGASTFLSSLRQSKLPTSDGVYRSGKAVLDQLNGLVRGADSGGSPSTAPYNKATTAFSKVCASL